MSELSQKPKANNAPTYMCLYPGLAEIARANGYALAVHGSLARDMDLIAVPWIDNPSSPEAVIAAIESDYGIRRIGDLTAAPHGRMVQTIGIQFGECFIDLSFMPSSGRNFNAGTASDAQPSGDHMESGNSTIHFTTPSLMPETLPRCLKKYLSGSMTASGAALRNSG